MRRKYTKEYLCQLVQESTCWADVCRKAGIRPATGSQTHLTRRAKALGITASHFTGKCWNKGRKFPKKPTRSYLIKGSTISSSKLRDRLLNEGLKERKCEKCGLIEWLEEPAPLELHHRNRDHWDNRMENFQVLCPNCHAVETKMPG